jgi:hypothetical protein
MLRLGRAIFDPIPPNVKFGHWRQVCTPEGLGWMNLNQPRQDADFGVTLYAGIGVYSDVDFPHRVGWSLIDDDKSGTSLCESATIKRWLDLDGNDQVTHAEAEKARHSDEVKARMAMTICRFPIEWSRQSIDERWGWLMKPHPALSAPLTRDKFDLLKAHTEALAFWEDIDAPGLPPASGCWRRPPTAFIRQMRQCMWLSEGEMQQLLPMYIVRQDGHGKFYWEPVNHDDKTDSLIKAYRASLNRTLRQYGINTPLRTAASFAQATVESARFTSLKEGGQHPPSVHQGWHGRGFLQLTAPNGNLNLGNNNYYHYCRRRGRLPQNVPLEQRLRWRENVAIDPDDAAQSAGFCWVKTQFSARSEHAAETALEYSDQASPNVRISATVAHGEHSYYRNETARRTAAMVNVPGAVYGTHTINSLSDRYCAYVNALVVLVDMPTFPDAHGFAGERPEHFQRRESW